MGITFPNKSNMRLSLIAGVVVFGLCHAAPGGSGNLDMNEKQFEELFHLDPVTDAKELKRRQEALSQQEKEIKTVNAEYKKGESSFFEAQNEFSDLPEDEFCKQKTGMHMDFGTGMLQPLPEQRVDEASEIYFNQFRYSRSSVPDSYNAIWDGVVSPIKNQGKCGSCVAFASMSSIEACFQKSHWCFWRLLRTANGRLWIRHQRSQGLCWLCPPCLPQVGRRQEGEVCQRESVPLQGHQVHPTVPKQLTCV